MSDLKKNNFFLKKVWIREKELYLCIRLSKEGQKRKEIERYWLRDWYFEIRESYLKLQAKIKKGKKAEMLN